MVNEQRILIYFDDVVNALVKEYGEAMDLHLYSPREIVESIGNIRRVDAVEVVRCKDCKHWKPSGSMAGNTEYDLQPIGGCKWVNCCRKTNDFCSYGERRSE